MVVPGDSWKSVAWMRAALRCPWERCNCAPRNRWCWLGSPDGAAEPQAAGPSRGLGAGHCSSLHVSEATGSQVVGLGKPTGGSDVAQPSRHALLGLDAAGAKMCAVGGATTGPDVSTRSSPLARFDVAVGRCASVPTMCLPSKRVTCRWIRHSPAIDLPLGGAAGSQKESRIERC